MNIGSIKLNRANQYIIREIRKHDTLSDLKKTNHYFGICMKENLTFFRYQFCNCVNSEELEEFDDKSPTRGVACTCY